MAVKTFSQYETLTAADTNTYLANAGLVYVKSQTIGSGVTSVTVTDAFSATYDNYKIIVQGGVCSTETSFSLQMGSTTTGYNYAITYQQYNSTAVSGASSSGAAAAWIEGGRCSTAGINMNVEVFQPFLNLRTGYRSQSIDMKPTDGYIVTGGGVLNDTNSYTSFLVKPNAGTITGGTITVYGYRKA